MANKPDPKAPPAKAAPAKASPAKAPPSKASPPGTPSVQLHEHLVAQTLKMNPGLAGGQAAPEFIRNQTSKLGDAAKSPARTPAERTSEVRHMSAWILGERRKQQQAVQELDRRRKQIEKEGAEGRKEALSQLVSYLTRNVHSVEDLQAVLEENKVYLQELATSSREVVEQVANRRKSLT